MVLVIISLTAVTVYSQREYRITGLRKKNMHADSWEIGAQLKTN